MGNWGSYRDSAKALGGGGGRFLKFQDGESATFVVLGEPMVRYSIWDNENRKYESVPPGTHGAAKKFMMNVINKESLERQILEVSGRVFDDVAAELQEAGADAEVTMLRMKRRGTGKDTRYTVVALGKAEGGLATMALRESEDVDGLAADLAKLGAVSLTPPAARAPAQDEDIPF